MIDKLEGILRRLQKVLYICDLPSVTQPFQEIAAKRRVKGDLSSITIAIQELELDNLRLRNQISLGKHTQDLDEIKKIVKEMEIMIKDEIFVLCVQNNEDYLNQLKLIEARKADESFEAKLAEMIHGGNEKFLYRNNKTIEIFFQNLGLPHEVYIGRFGVLDFDGLRYLDTKEIYRVVNEGLFRRQDFVKHAEIKHLDVNVCIDEAQKEFKNFLDECIHVNDVVDIGPAFGLNVHAEILFEKEFISDDSNLNELIKSAKNYFLKGPDEDKQTALQKLWDAFERIKTYYADNKKQSANQLIGNLPKIDDQFYEGEFKTLTDLGNNYAIRHHEKNRRKITDIPLIDYLFFRMLSLLDLCLNSIKKNKKNNPE